jgi:hypothetical protein
MPQEQDALFKVGRGGAGNYISSKQAEEASKVNFAISFFPDFLCAVFVFA